MLAAFRRTFESAKASAVPVGFGWYPYDSLASFEEILRLRPDGFEGLFAELAGRRVLDVGCADGAMSFYLASRGLAVTALDSPVYNFNQMRGVEELNRRLGASVEIRQVDLERELLAADEDFGLAVAMGLLYHLRNPISFLQRLAQCASHSFLSTRVVAGVPGGRVNAYLVDSTELGEDETNYWLFTPDGMERLLKRTGWELVAARQVAQGDDTRWFCHARSLVKPAWWAVEGVHAAEEHGWRWTARQFALGVQAPRAGWLALDVVVHEALAPLTASLRVDGAFEAFPMQAAGEHTLRVRAPQAGSVVLHVELDRALAPGGGDARELGLILKDLRWQAE